MEDLTLFEGLVDVVAWGDEEKGAKDEGEGGEGGGVEDAEEGDAGAAEGELHGKDMGGARMIGVMMLGSCCEDVGGQDFSFWEARPMLQIPWLTVYAKHV